MTRVNRSSTQRHKKLLAQAKGYFGRNARCYRIAKRVVEKGLQYAYRDRRNKKREMRGLWIQRINAGARELGMTYSTFMYSLKQQNVIINRKLLSILAANGQLGSLLNQSQAK